MAYSKKLHTRMLPPIDASITAVSREMNHPYATPYAWRTQTSRQPAPVPPAAESDDQFDSQAKTTYGVVRRLLV